MDNFDIPYDDSEGESEQFPIPFANIGRRKRLFRPDAYDQVDTSTPNDEAYAKYLSNAPNRKDYELGTGGKIMNALVSGLAGFTGGPKLALQTAESNKDAPFNEAVSDWKLRGAGMEKLAEIEGRRINTNLHVAQGHEKFAHDVTEESMKQQETDDKNQNAALDRTVRANHWNATDNQNEINQNNLASYRTGELKARDARTNAIRERTTMMGNRSKGSQVKPHNIANESHAMTSALADVLAQSPAAKALFEPDGAGGYIPVPRSEVILDAKGNKRPLTRNELTAQQKIMQHVKQRAQEFLTQGLTGSGEAPGTIIDQEDDSDESEQ